MIEKKPHQSPQKNMLSMNHEPDIDIDRIVWDTEYRQEIKILLDQHSLSNQLKQKMSAELLSTSHFSFKTAFQPIIDVKVQNIFAYEALARGRDGRSVEHFLNTLRGLQRYTFDHLCRIQALKDAVRHKMEVFLSLNVFPNSISDERYSIFNTLLYANEIGLKADHLIFEISEKEFHNQPRELSNYLDMLSSHGALVAIDDFGKGYSSFALLADIRPHLLKLDISLIRNIQKDEKRKIIVDTIVDLGVRLNFTVIAEGVETVQEVETLLSLGVCLMQGFYFAKPCTEMLPGISPERFPTSVMLRSNNATPLGETDSILHDTPQRVRQHRRDV